ncbi:MAG TPA: hypothetical protein VJB57_14605 [Dehalococcoidia bacterium]|nr:hypothetical protein [Dehalococcoidia bacterium]
MAREIVWTDDARQLKVTVTPTKSDRGWFLAGVTIRDNDEHVVAWFNTYLDPVLWMDSSGPWHTNSEEAAEELLGRRALDLAKQAIKHGTHEGLHKLKLFGWEDGSIAAVAEKMDESREELGPIPVSTSILVHEGRSQE